MKNFKQKTAVITGAASGFGLCFAREAVKRGMNVALLDVEEKALQNVAAELCDSGVKIYAKVLSVADAKAYATAVDEIYAMFGSVNLVFNNAGVGTGGLIWENSLTDWDWVMGVNVNGVIYGMHYFIPRMLADAKKDATFEGHIVNTASMAGLLTAPNMGVYNASKHAVVAMTETLYQDLSLVTEQINCSVLCPYFVPTGISKSDRNLPQGVVQNETASKKIAQAMSEKAVSSGNVSAEQVSDKVFAAIEAKQFYIYSHPQALGNVQARMESIVMGTNPADPFQARPDIGEKLRAQLRSAS